MPLTRYVPEDYPLYGLQARGLDGTGQLARSVQEMAADYIVQIRNVQETGPYYLLGWSFGGIVAQEIAVQLQGAGEQVAALITMDGAPQPPDAPVQVAENDENSRRRNAPEQFLEFDELRRQYGGDDCVISDEDLMNAVRVFNNNTKLAHSHDFKRFDGDLFIVASAAASDIAVPAWRPYISGKISECVLTCAHVDMAQPEMLAQAWLSISRWLDLESE
jgi:thioesterase domain-containing protein